MRIRELAFYFGVLMYLCPPVCIGFGVGKRRRNIDNWKYDDTCSRDCSQTVPRFSGDTTIFNCTVGNLSEVKKFRENYKKKMEKAEIRFDPPKLLGIDFYHKHYEQDGLSEGALNITFQLPKGKLDGYQEVEYPLAVFLHFESVEDPKFRDSFYYNNPRDRIFQFLNYKPKILFDSVNPRNISYDCLVGLDDSKPKVAYTITLETAFGDNITYYCTVYVRQGTEVGYPINWLPTIVTYLNLSDRSVHVVFEEYKEVKPDRNLYYNVSLIKNDTNVETVVDHKKITGKHEATFTYLKHGKYVVRVTKCEEDAYTILHDDNQDSPKCISSTSYEIDATSIPAEQTQESPITYTEEHDTLQLALAIGLGCLIGFTAVALLILVFLKARKKDASHSSSCDGGKKPTGLILYRYTANQKVIERFVLYLQHICNCFTHVDILEKDKDKLKNPEKWCSDILKTATFVIIVCSKDSYNIDCRIPQTQSEKFYRWAIQKAVSKKTSSNDIRIIPVKFSIAPNEIVPDISPKMTCLTLMEDVFKLYNSIHSYKKIQKDIQDKIHAETYFTKSQEGSDLKQAVDNARQTTEPKCVILDDPSNSQLLISDKDKQVQPDKTNCDNKKTCLSESLELKSEIKSFHSGVMDKLADFNTSESSIDSIAMMSDEQDGDIDTEIHEDRPLLFSVTDPNDIKTDMTREEGCIRTRAHSGIEHYEAAKETTINNYLENIERNRLTPGIQMTEAHHCRNHMPLNQSHFYHNQKNPIESKRLYRHNLPEAYYQNMNQPHVSVQQPVVPHNLGTDGVPRVTHVCQMLGNRGHFQSPEFETNLDYTYGRDVPSEEYSNPDYVTRTYHSYPQEQYSQYQNRNLHHQHVSKHFKPMFEFQAVDPPESEGTDCHVILLNKKYQDKQIDSGYGSGIPHDLGAKSRTQYGDRESRIQMPETAFNAEVLNQRTETLTMEHLEGNIDNGNGKCIVNDEKRHGKLSSSARYSYPLSLNLKRDFNSEMFIPPDDLDSCLSEEDDSSNEIMDQLASINDRTED